ncbi:3-deoxy-D-manno-octulosonic acid kinase [Gayadomonas joobiniege]|uniref:3-deoxy-D-manno-octulosonic acid kinase n=1 Tax=Gayadomonas joobiniege TaxID=1234606 RepID=UPI00035CA0C2|nr:3-deoxy-D-manno-octulosonic acid kinase [Gayadomonas joobiniege]
MPQLTPITNTQSLILPKNNIAAVDNDWFNAEYWRQKNQITGESYGRNTTYFFSFNKQEYVLRHYFRGGMVGRILQDAYFFTGYKNTRVWREFALLEHMEKAALPVPKPIAARVQRRLWYYTADIIITRIDGANDLLHCLKKMPLNEQQWQQIGKTIALFHQHGIYHADLNIHNIMLDANDKVWLIDFDRGRKRSIKASWQQANLNRLQQSFYKEKRKHPGLHWQPSDWQKLLSAYMSAQQH